MHYYGNRSNEKKIEELETVVETQNEALSKASNSGDNSAMIEHSKAVADTQKEIENLFERLEVASDALDEINSTYEVKLAELE
ncbi:MAG: hypothetical protein E3J96_02360 [Sulfurovum sp.]|nr:MAG: hypothetical protein E3J96_02360 [Sulfurovum sp.]